MGQWVKLHLYLQWLLIAHVYRFSQCDNNRNKVPNKFNVLESSWNHPVLTHGKIVFHENGPWCQKVWGPLLYWNTDIEVSNIKGTLNYCVPQLLPSVQFSCSVVSDSFRPHELQHAMPPCPSPTPGVHPNPCPSSQWCHPTISSSVVPFSSCPQSFSASGSFPMSQLFPSGGQSIAVSASTSVLPMNTQDWSPLGWTGWISLQSKGLSRVFSNTTVQKHQFFRAQLSL